jgi:hypothetical protein
LHLSVIYLQDTVASLITDMLQWPHRIVVPLGGVDVDVRSVNQRTCSFTFLRIMFIELVAGSSSTCQLEEHVVITQVLVFPCSDLELKPHGKLTVTVVRADSLKNMEFIGKSDPYVVLFIRPIFKEKTRVIDDNLNPEWNETFELITEDKETQCLVLEAHTLTQLLLIRWAANGADRSSLFYFTALSGVRRGQAEARQEAGHR